MPTYTSTSRILRGKTLVTAAQCSAYILSRAHGAYDQNDIANKIIPAYFRVCASVEVEPGMVIAQMIHETDALNSVWAQRPLRNPAGIGVTGRAVTTEPPTGRWVQRGGSWIEGVAFPSWEQDSIPAHVGRLLAFAIFDTAANPVQRELIRFALSIRALPPHFRGSVDRWQGLNGRWAVPGTTYATRIATIANRILETKP